MIKKCDFPGCEKAGVCPAPKDRSLSSYYHFCREHAAEYNKNWNFYKDMTPQEIEEDWERLTFGESLKDKKKASKDKIDYVKFLNDFIGNRGVMDNMPTKKSIPGKTLRAFKTLDLPITATKKEAQMQYRKLAKMFHPDTTKHIDKDAAARAFSAISDAFAELEKYFK